jgi:hypothetical protein
MQSATVSQQSIKHPPIKEKEKDRERKREREEKKQVPLELLNNCSQFTK